MWAAKDIAVDKNQRPSLSERQITAASIAMAEGRPAWLPDGLSDFEIGEVMGRAVMLGGHQEQPLVEWCPDCTGTGMVSMRGITDACPRCDGHGRVVVGR